MRSRPGRALERRASCAVWLFAAGVAFVAPGAWGAKIDRLEVRYDEGRYHLAASAVIEAPREAVFAVLTDYALLPRFDPSILESRVLETQPGGVSLVWTRVRGCVVLFCREIERVERIEEHPPGTLTATIIPERSDLRFEIARWQLEPAEARTNLRYELELEPDFWVPRIARGAFKRQIKDSFENTVRALEQLAGTPLATAGP